MCVTPLIERQGALVNQFLPFLEGLALELLCCWQAHDLIQHVSKDAWHATAVASGHVRPLMIIYNQLPANCVEFLGCILGLYFLVAASWSFLRLIEAYSRLSGFTWSCFRAGCGFMELFGAYRSLFKAIEILGVCK